MKRVLPCLLTLVLALPITTPVHGDDKAYCAEHSALCRRYVQSAPGRRFDVEASVALDNCQKGNTAAAIPVLEKTLRESGLSLPKGLTP